MDNDWLVLVELGQYVEVGAGWYLVVPGQYRVGLVDMLWYWVSTGRYWLVLGGSGRYLVVLGQYNLVLLGTKW